MANKLPLKVFISYSHQDEKWKDDLLAQLTNMQMQGLISIWQDRMISPGDLWDDSIKQALRDSDLVLFMVSPSFMTSHYVWNDELPAAIERQKRKESRLVPIYVIPVESVDAPFSPFQGLPRDHYNGNFLSQLGNRDTALFEIATSIRKLVMSMSGNF
jgi:hypothetical protein